ncbi:unnamed protein product [Pieris brassicae]|uniref:Uncharacterized protein n=1 Tax=Pieris brassicae TaxID=7116 RepID=A0A9P0X689_PIEBR|nr:unnamed protein product [Pieris brassicae]
MSERKSNENTTTITFDPILPDSGILFYEECPKEYEIDPPILLPLKSTTQIRFEELQSEAVRAWKVSQKTARKKE